MNLTRLKGLAVLSDLLMLKNIIRFAPSIAGALVCIFVCFALLDALWLGVIASSWYQDAMASIIRSDIITWPWLVFYLLYVGVVFVLAVVANRDQSLLYACIDGALLGLASYGTYNLTNYSVIEGFPLNIAMIDWAWGIVITSISAGAGWLGFQKFRNDTTK